MAWWVTVLAVCSLLVLSGCAGPASTPDTTGTQSELTTTDTWETTASLTEPTPEAPLSTTTRESMDEAPMSTTTPPPPSTTESPVDGEPTADSETESMVTDLPVPPGATPTYSPDPDPPSDPDTVNQAFETASDPRTVTEWYRTNLSEWTLRTWTDEYNPTYGWMNRQVFTTDDEALFVLVSSPGGTTQILLSKGDGVIGVAPWLHYPELGFGTRTFEVSPLEASAISSVTPIGNLAPPGHTFPTDHSYLAVPDEDRPATVRAPADGMIVSVTKQYLGDPPEADYSLEILHSNSFRTKFGHMSGLSPAIREALGEVEDGRMTVSVPIQAGDVLGTAPIDGSTSLDWWVLDLDQHHTGFIHPEYYSGAVHAVSPLATASPVVEALLREKLVRESPPLGGKIDYDRPGRLVGNWFLDVEDADIRDGSRHLSFVYDVRDADNLRIGVGGTIMEPGLFAVDGNGPDPETVGPASGPVVYHLQTAYGSGQVNDRIVATILVEVLDGERIKVESFDGRVADPSFTEDARVYVR